MHIIKISGREILDSRGNPTVEADVYLENGVMGRAAVPSGASTGSKEACELRDNDFKRYLGKGVQLAVHNINELIFPKLKNISAVDQEQIDTILCELDGTQNKTRLGANAILAVSLAVADARAHYEKKPRFLSLNQGESMNMPVPMMNVLNGGAHADNNVDIQEFMVMPAGAKDFPSALQMGTEIFHALKATLKKAGLNTAVGDEGGFAPDVKSNRHALDLLSEAIYQTGYGLGKEVFLALDVAASELYKDKKYFLNSENTFFESYQLVEYYQDLVKNYPIISIEDGLDEQDWDGWKVLTETLGQKIQLVGDDIFVTNAEILKEGINQHIANAILIKVNQIGTLTETWNTLKLAKNNDYRCIMSHRSGETEDVFIADLAVASGCGQIKTGSLCRTDRVAKYNQLLRINQSANLPYAGKAFLDRYLN